MRCALNFWQTGFLVGLSMLMSGTTSHPTRPSSITVHIFLSTECPISQQYVRQLTELQRRYKPSGIHFMAWFPLRTDSPRIIRQFQTEYKLSFAGKPDPGARLARQLRVRVTPEVVVMQSDGQVRYQGAIDDWYVSLGRHRSEVTKHYLCDALDAILIGSDVAVAKTDAVGCVVE